MTQNVCQSMLRTAYSVIQSIPTQAEKILEKLEKAITSLAFPKIAAAELTIYMSGGAEPVDHEFIQYSHSTLPERTPKTSFSKAVPAPAPSKDTFEISSPQNFRHNLSMSTKDFNAVKDQSALKTFVEANTNSFKTPKTREFYIAVIDQIDSTQEGIFRLSGAKSKADEAFASRDNPDRVTILFQTGGLWDANTAVTTLKKTLGTDPILSPIGLNNLKNEEAIKQIDPQIVYEQVTEGISQERREVFNKLLDKMLDTANNENTTKMGSDNLAIAIGPTLFRCFFDIQHGAQEAFDGNVSPVNQVIMSKLFEARRLQKNA